MKKNPLITREYPCEKKKILGKMRITLLFVLLFGFYAEASSQKVTLKVKDMNLYTVLSQLKNQTGVRMLYDADYTKQIKCNDATFQEEDITIALEKLLKNTPLTFNVVNGVFVINKTSENDEKQVKLSGIVKDNEGNPLPGVTIIIKGTTTGVSTDTLGKFVLNIKKQEKIILVFSFIGMETHEVEWKGEKQLEVTLQEAIAEMDEVIVTGYQQIEKRQLTSAVSTIKTDELNMIGSSSIEDMLQGQLAGLSVVNTSTAPGSAPKIRIRGTATIAGNAEPLWVLDGVMLENSVPITVAELNSPDAMNMFNSAIGGINPNDIESITVLKDASATAIYGTRAANGVIVVTTKKGKRGGFNISYQHSSAVSLRPNYRDFDLMDSRERVELTQQNNDDGLYIRGSVGMENLINRYAKGYLTLEQYKHEVATMETRNTDWFKLLYRNAYTQTHNLSFSGGSESVDYYMSLSYNDEQGSDKQTNYRNFGGLAKMNAELFKGVCLGTTLQVGRRDRETYHSSIDPFAYAAGTSRTIPIYDENNNYFFYKRNDGLNSFNILNEQANTNRESTQTDLKAIVNLSVNLYKGIKYNGLYSYSSSHSTSSDYAKEQSAYIAELRGFDFGEQTQKEFSTTSIPYGGVYNETTYTQRTSLIRNSLEYKGQIAESLSIDAMLGQEFRTTDYRGLTSQGYGYMHDRGNIFYTPALQESTGHIERNQLIRNIPKRSYISYYGVFSAMFKGRYVVNANIRFDGSNLFGSNPKYRYLPLWSVSGKWTISNENFLRNNPVINNLALRASYGLRGNIVEESTPQIIAAALPPNENNSLLEMEIVQAPNPELKWETTQSTNFGLEIGLFDSRLNLDIDYYRDYSRDLIAAKDVSSVTGFLNKYVNYADVKNQGVDIAFSSQIIRKKNISWIASINLGYVNNKVVKSSITPQVKSLVKSIYTPGEVHLGKPVNAMFSYRFAELDDNGMPLYYDMENNKLGEEDPEIETAVYNNIDNLLYEGTRDPIVTGGFNNIIKYKDFTLSFLFSFGLKNTVRLPEFAYTSAPSADQNVNRSIMKRWRKPGDEAITVIPGLTSRASGDSHYTKTIFNQSQVTTVPGDYLRLRNVMLEYRLPQTLVKKIIVGERPLGGISFKFQAQNLFVWANKQLKGYDPETINYTTTTYGSMPLPTSFTLGLNINF